MHAFAFSFEYSKNSIIKTSRQILKLQQNNITVTLKATGYRAKDFKITFFKMAALHWGGSGVTLGS